MNPPSKEREFYKCPICFVLVCWCVGVLVCWCVSVLVPSANNLTSPRTHEPTNPRTHQLKPESYAGSHS